MRCFIALDLPEGFSYDVCALARQLSQRIEGRLVPEGNHHITLAFLGEVGEAQAQRAIEAMDVACAGRDAVELRATELGKFGRAHDATLWLGVDGGDGLFELADDLRSELTERGVSLDEKAFRPHVTLMRRADTGKADLRDLVFHAPDTAARVTLFRSYLSSEGAEYKPLYSVDLDT